MLYSSTVQQRARPLDLQPKLKSWLGDIPDLIQQGVFDGYALLTVKGIAQPVVGPLAAELSAPSGVLPDIARQFLSVFNTADDTKDSFIVLGNKVLVVHNTCTSLYALSKGRTVGIAAAQLPFGVLLVTFNRRTHLPVAVSHLERCFQRLRS
mmetsp:Transcript_13928/g.30092  ORF Transcript_13928/g.30092 Transcript_13928/m.30092 type:complete len:152 (+) Transcript_13928:136-591(+)